MIFSLVHNTKIRGHPLKLGGGMLEQAKNISQHVINLWNSLPQDVVIAPGLDAFVKGIVQTYGGKVHHKLEAMMDIQVQPCYTPIF